MTPTEQVLAWCNDIRAQLKLPPMDALCKGEREECELCPVAETIVHGAEGWTALVTYDYYEVFNNPKGQPMLSANKLLHDAVPLVVTQWIHDFDDGFYPEYDMVPLVPPEGL